MSHDDPGAAYEALLAFLYQTPFGLLEIDTAGAVGMANPMAVQLLMPLAAEGSIDNLFQALQPIAPQLRKVAAGLPVDPMHPGAELRLADAAAGRSLALRMVRLASSRLMVSVTDVTLADAQEAQRLASRVHDVQRTDALTALPNRQAMLDVLNGLLGGADVDGLALLLINLDRFERVNTRLGTAMGDQVLCEVATRLSQSLRLHDHLGTAARLGGDEFVVLLRHLRQSGDAERVALRLIRALALPCRLGEQQVEVGASIGVLAGASIGRDAEGALHDAALAMREAKRQGGGRHVVFHADTREHALAAARVEHELRLALRQNELFVVYQPIVPLAPDERLGVEALVRWQHPGRGLVPPDQFIAAAESSGLIVPLGAFVLEQACRQFMAWQRVLGAQAPGKVSVNASRAELQSPDFVATVRRLLEATAMPAAALQIEVTESMAAQHEELRAVLLELKALGVRIALDDFGTGFSSLSSLHQLPVDVVKIDRSFVRQLTTSHHHVVLVEATLMVARSLGMGTVAEGVETEEQAAALGRLRCASAQGYLYTRPQRADDITGWLRARAQAECFPAALHAKPGVTPADQVPQKVW